MMWRRLREVVIVCGVGAVMLCAPATSSACYLLDRLFGCGRTTYSPPMTAAYAPPSCMYTPQTCYRTYFRPVPVLACRPVTACDPCGGATTAYRPVRAWAYQACLVPYTTYRVTYSNPCATACAPCGSVGSPCGTGGCGTTTYAPSAGCSSCGTASPVYSSPAPVAPVPGPTDMSAPPAASPTLPAAPGLGTPATITPAPAQTFENGAFGPGPNNETPSRAIPSPLGTPAPANTLPSTAAPENGASRSMNGVQPVPRSPVPSLPARDGGFRSNIVVPTQPPETPNRTASRPVHQAAHYQLISTPKVSDGYNPEGLDDSGWHAARD